MPLHSLFGNTPIALRILVGHLWMCKWQAIHNIDGANLSDASGLGVALTFGYGHATKDSRIFGTTYIGKTGPLIQISKCIIQTIGIRITQCNENKIKIKDGKQPTHHHHKRKGSLHAQGIQQSDTPN